MAKFPNKSLTLWLGFWGIGYLTDIILSTLHNNCVSYFTQEESYNPTYCAPPTTHPTKVESR